MDLVKVVLDTNVYIMAAGARGNYADYWLHQAGKRYHLFISPEILAELELKLRSKLNFETNDIKLLRRDIEELATIVQPTRRLKVVKSDPDDNKILECALSAQAQLIISADRDLTRLKRHQDIQIFHPSMLKYIFPEQQSPAA